MPNGVRIAADLRATLGLVLLAVVVGCRATQPPAVTMPSGPRLADRCVLQSSGCLVAGRLRLLGGGRGSASVDTEDHCFELALPPGFIARHRSWSGKDVEVFGRPHWRADFPELMWQVVEDREIEAGGCGDIVLYVLEIRRL